MLKRKTIRSPTVAKKLMIIAAIVTGRDVRWKKALDDLKKVSFWLDCMIHLTLHFHGKQLWVNSVGALLKQDHVLANSRDLSNR